MPCPRPRQRGTAPSLGVVPAGSPSPATAGPRGRTRSVRRRAAVPARFSGSAREVYMTLDGKQSRTDVPRPLGGRTITLSYCLPQPLGTLWTLGHVNGVPPGRPRCLRRRATRCWCPFPVTLIPAGPPRAPARSPRGVMLVDRPPAAGRRSGIQVLAPGRVVAADYSEDVHAAGVFSVASSAPPAIALYRCVDRRKADGGGGELWRDGVLPSAPRRTRPCGGVECFVAEFPAFSRIPLKNDHGSQIARDAVPKLSAPTPLRTPPPFRSRSNLGVESAAGRRVLARRTREPTVGVGVFLRHCRTRALPFRPSGSRRASRRRVLDCTGLSSLPTAVLQRPRASVRTLIAGRNGRNDCTEGREAPPTLIPAVHWGRLGQKPNSAPKTKRKKRCRRANAVRGRAGTPPRPFTNVDKVWVPEAGITKSTSSTLPSRRRPLRPTSATARSRLAWPPPASERQPPSGEEHAGLVPADSAIRVDQTRQGRPLRPVKRPPPPPPAYLVHHGCHVPPVFLDASKIDRPTHVGFDLDPARRSSAPRHRAGACTRSSTRRVPDVPRPRQSAST